MSNDALFVENLSIAAQDGTTIVDNVSFHVKRGEILGFVGESGSGKSTTALAMFGFQTPGARVTGGSILVDGQEIIDLPVWKLREIRGGEVSYVPQDPGAALNPSMRVKSILRAQLRLHRRDQDSQDSVLKLLRRVELPADVEFLGRYPHQLSGGQQQRLCIAVALASRPKVVVFDEPTTGLDVLTQQKILEEIKLLRDDLGIAMMYISHDLRVVGGLADRVMVMRGGQIVEKGMTSDVLFNAEHTYTQSLLDAVPDHRRLMQSNDLGHLSGGKLSSVERVHLPGSVQSHVALTVSKKRVPSTVETAATPLLEVTDLVVEYPQGGHVMRALHEVSFKIARGEKLALVGGSGSGKSTLTRCIAGLISPASGSIHLDGISLRGRVNERSRSTLQRMQMIFQNPYESLNPRQTVLATITRPAQVLRGLNLSDAAAEAKRLLSLVKLPSKVEGAYPSQLSGGERQRVALAAALAAKPELLLCDEVTSSLDVSVQASVIELLLEISESTNVGLLFVSHDLGVVATIADRIAVMEHGRLVEQETRDEFFSQPKSAYGRALLEAAPTLENMPVPKL